jgi:hypothetical protein
MAKKNLNAIAQARVLNDEPLFVFCFEAAGTVRPLSITTKTFFRIVTGTFDRAYAEC